MRIWRSPKAARSVTARKERPIRRWISWVRPVWLPRAASRSVRVWVARGSMPYSAVTQPRPVLRRKGGGLSSTVAAAQHVGLAEHGQARAFGVFGGIGLEAHVAHRIGGTARGARHGVPFRLKQGAS